MIVRYINVHLLLLLTQPLVLRLPVRGDEEQGGAHVPKVQKLKRHSQGL